MVFFTPKILGCGMSCFFSPRIKNCGMSSFLKLNSPVLTVTLDAALVMGTALVRSNLYYLFTFDFFVKIKGSVSS